MGLRNRLPAHLAETGGGAKQPLPDVLGSRFAGTRLVLQQPAASMQDADPGALVPGAGSFALAFGCILDALWPSENCQHLDKAGGFTPKRLSMICFEKRCGGGKGGWAAPAAKALLKFYTAAAR